MSEKNLKITAHLAGTLVGEAPHLDGLLEYARATRGVQGWQAKSAKVDRGNPAPPIGGIAIPITRRKIGGHLVACCSSPILVGVHGEQQDHTTKRLESKRAPLLHESQRKTINHGAGPTKAYYIPLRTRLVERVVYFCVAHHECNGRNSPRSVLRNLLKRIPFIGKRYGIGYGAVGKWEIEDADADLSWYAESEAGTVLMRPLPGGSHLPPALIGARPSYGACQPPYWHPERYMEIVEPC